jgi:hypothetical protein
MILERSSYAGRVITDSPIYGILTQPYTSVNEPANTQNSSLSGTYIPSSHVKFLESAGARVVPINYRL